MTNKKTHDETEMGSFEALKKLIPLFAPYKWGVGFCVSLLLIISALTVFKGLLIRHAIDISMAERNWQDLLMIVGLYLLAQAALLGLSYAQRIKLEKIGQTIIAGLKERLFAKILRLSLSYFDRNPSGKLMARVESDTDSLRMFFTFAITVIIGDFLLLAGIFVTMALISPRLTLIISTAAPLVLALTYIYQKLTNHRFLQSRKRMAEITSRIAEFLQSIAIVQVFHRMRYAQQKVLEVNREKFLLDRFAHIGATTYFNIIFFTEAALIAAILFFGGKWLGQGAITIGVIVMFIQFLRKMFEPIYRFSDELYVIQKAISGLKRIYALLETDETIPQVEREYGLNRMKDEIRFENVSFSYTNDDNYALRDVSFAIKPGERIALVGVTGGGKSSIINLLLRFYDPQKGAATIDGVDIRKLRKDELRRLYGLVLQDIYLFPGDINSNITLGADEIAEEKIRSAAETVGADQFIETLPEKYKAEVAERGANLSRGERQLLSFARALAFDPQVLILDEATSSVDPETERRIQAALAKLLANRTSLIVAHRLSTILACDRILVIKDGQIIESGSHTELVAQEGYYHSLFRLQFAPEQRTVKETADG